MCDTWEYLQGSRKQVLHSLSMSMLCYGKIFSTRIMYVVCFGNMFPLEDVMAFHSHLKTRWPMRLHGDPLTKQTRVVNSGWKLMCKNQICHRKPWDHAVVRFDNNERIESQHPNLSPGKSLTATSAQIGNGYYICCLRPYMRQRNMPQVSYIVFAANQVHISVKY